MSFTKFTLGNIRKVYKYIYGICEKDLFRFYQLIGFNKIDEKEYYGEKEFLLELNFENCRY